VKPETGPDSTSIQRKHDLSFRALNILRRMNIDPTPVNFELMLEIISGNNPELARKFSSFGKDISRADVEKLAREYLPHHFEDTAFDRSSRVVQSELGSLQEIMSESQISLKSYSTSLGSAANRFSQIDPRDTNRLQREIEQIRAATDRQQSESVRVSQVLAKQMDVIGAVSREMEVTAKAKFTHMATGLGNRRAFYKSMAELFRSERFPDGVSLVFGHIANMAALEAPQLFKIRERMLARLGEYLLHELGEDEEAFWLEGPHLAIVLRNLTDSAIQDFASRLNRILIMQIEPLRDQIQHGKSLLMQFGVSNTYGASNSADLIKTAEEALQEAVAGGEHRTVFHGAAPIDAGGKAYALYGRQGSISL